MKSENIGVRRKVFAVFFAFGIFLILILWLLQTVFLNSFYRSVRLKEVYLASDLLLSKIDSDNFYEYLVSAAKSKDMCVIITDENGKVLYSADVLPNCVIHQISNYDYRYFYNLARDNGGEYMLRVNLDLGQSFSHFPEAVDEYKENGVSESIVYSVISESGGNTYCVIINAILEPVNATVNTLTIQLIIASVAMIFAATILAYILSRNIAVPIIKLNDKSKLLAKGDYSVDFTSKGYREIYELGQTLNLAEKELKKTGNLQKELIANISHDLRTPLTMISGYAEVMRDIPGENNTENAQIIIDESKRLSTIVSDVLDISRIQAGTEPVIRENFNLTSDVKEISLRFSRLTEHEGYDIRFSGEGEYYVNADRMMISRVVYNLVNNAVTHTGSNRTILIIQQVTDKRVRISVKDYGKGIPDSELDSIWERYYKVDKEHKRAAVGSGLGLSIVKTILNMHQATFGVESTVGKGSVFWFELPIVKP